MKLEQPTRLSVADTARLALVVVPVGGLCLAALADSLPTIAALREVVDLPGFWESYTFTVVVAVAATGVAAGGAAAAGFVIARRPRPPRRSVLGLLHYNIGMPHLVWAVALSTLLAPSGWVARFCATIGVIDRPDQFPILVNDVYGIGIVSHLVTKELPFVLLATLPLIGERLRSELAQTATLGAPPRSQFRHVYLPRIAPALVPATVVVFAFAVGGYEPGAVLGVQRPRTLPVVAVDWFRDSTLARRDHAFAVTAILMATTVVVGATFALAARHAWWPPTRRRRSAGATE